MSRVTLRVAHQKDCANANLTALSSAPTSRSRNGCTCAPRYYTFRRDDAGRVVKAEKFTDEHGQIIGGRFTDRQTADRVASKLQRLLDEERAGLTPPKSTTLGRWVDEYDEILATAVRMGEIKPRTRAGYSDSLRRARAVLGDVELRRIGWNEIDRYYRTLENLAPASRARELKHLSRSFTEAKRRKYLETNPIPEFKADKKLGKLVPKRGKGPFEEGELARLWPAFAEVRGGKNEPVYRYLAEFGAETGMRLGELIALDWSAVAGALDSARVDWTWSNDELVLPKDGEKRVVYLTAEARAVLEAWIRVNGDHDDGPVFPAPEGGRLSARNMQRRLDAAMVKAGIPKVHPGMQRKRSFHSLRYSTSVLMQLRGRHPRFIEQTLGHGTLELSFNVYGQWTPEQLAAEAARAEAA